MMEILTEEVDTLGTDDGNFDKERFERPLSV